MTMTAAEFVALLEQHAPRLREAGVLSIRVSDGVAEATFAPAAPPVVDAKGANLPQTADPLDDPALYHDGRVPGYALEGEPTEGAG